MIKFLSAKTVLTFHEDQLVQYGGNRGVRDKTLLEKALTDTEKVLNEKTSADIYEVAAIYAVNVIKNDPFFDGLKRTVLIIIYTFLYVNGVRLAANKSDTFKTIVDLRNGRLNQEKLTDFLRKNSKART